MDDKKLNGYECLVEELKKRGIPKAAANGRAVAATVDILAETGGIILEFKDLEKKKEQLQSDIEFCTSTLAKLEAEEKEALKKTKIAMDNWYDVLSEANQKNADYIEHFYSELNNCETPEERDLLRKAQMFVNSVSVDTKYDNTAFIIGLAAILANGNVGAIDELRKINKRIPQVWSDGRKSWMD